PVQIPGETRGVVAVILPDGRQQGRCGRRKPQAMKNGLSLGAFPSASTAAEAIFQSAWASSFSRKTPPSTRTKRSGVWTTFLAGRGIGGAGPHVPNSVGRSFGLIEPSW